MFLLSSLKKQIFMNSFSIVVSDTQNTKEFMYFNTCFSSYTLLISLFVFDLRLYYKLIMDKYEYFEGAYDNSFDDMIAILLKPLWTKCTQTALQNITSFFSFPFFNSQISPSKKAF